MQSGRMRFLSTILFVLTSSMTIAVAQQNAPQGEQGRGVGVVQLKLTSPAFSDGAALPMKYTPFGEPANVSPPLEWTDVPKGTASFVLILQDLESSPRNGLFNGFLHWMAWNIPGNATRLTEGVSTASAELPDGSRQTNGGAGNSGNFAYRGPSAGVGVIHHYLFELFALDQKIDLPSSATRADAQKAMDGHIVGHAILISHFR